MKGILRALDLTSRSIQSIVEYRIRESELHKGQYVYILYVEANPGCSQLEISEGLLMDKTTVAKAVKKLETAGYLVRNKNAKDKRAVNIFLTEKGIRAHEMLEETIEDVLQVVYSGLDERDLKQLSFALHTLRRNIEKEWIAIKSYIRTGQVREAYSGDLLFLLELDHSLTKDEIEAGIKEHRLFVYELKTNILGYLLYNTTPPAAYEELPWLLDQEAFILHKLYVAKDHRRKGISTELLRFFESSVSEMGIRYVKGDCQSRNISMLRFFDHNGFKFVGDFQKEKTDYYCYEKILT